MDLDFLKGKKGSVFMCHLTLFTIENFKKVDLGFKFSMLERNFLYLIP